MKFGRIPPKLVIIRDDTPYKTEAILSVIYLHASGTFAGLSGISWPASMGAEA